MKKLIFLPKITALILLAIIFNCTSASAVDKTKFFECLANLEQADMHEDLKTWTDPRMVELLSKAPLTDEKVMNLYEEFTDTIITPPNPDIEEKLNIQDAQICLIRSSLLGRTFHNYLFAMSDDEVKKYGKLFHIMRDVLYLDWKHIPLAIKGDNSRNVFWYVLHMKCVQGAEDEYNRLYWKESDAMFYMDRYVLILESTKNYDEAVKFATEASKNLDLEFKSEHVEYSEDKGIYYLETSPGGGGYYPRRYSEEYISLENSSGYEGFTLGYIIVVAGVYDDKDEAEKALAKGKDVYSDAHIKKTNMWMGCIH